MAAVGEVLDVTWARVPTPNIDATPSFTLPIGGLWKPNDWRIVVLCGNLFWSAGDYATAFNSGTSTYTYSHLPPPAGWTVLTYELISGNQFGIMVLGRRMVAGDTDTEFSVVRPGGLYSGQPNYSAWISGGFTGPPTIFAFTVRGVDPTSTPTCTIPTGTTVQGPPPTFNSTITYSSRSIGSTPGWELFVFGSAVSSAQTPSGWTDVWDNGFTFDNAVRPSLMASSMGLLAKKYSSGSSSGSTVFSFPDGLNFTNPPYGRAGGDLGFPDSAFVLYFKQAQDVTASAGTAVAETDLANVATATLGTSVIVPTGTATGETDLANGASNGLTGFFARDPYILGAGPVLDSSIRWVETSVPGRSSVVVKASLDRGVTWAVCTNDGPIPGLVKGATNVDAVYVMGTITRLTTADAMPKIGSLEPHVATDDSRTEMVETGTFQVKTSDITAGMDAVTGGGSGSSAGVVSIGGGQTGGGRSITMKGSDLGRAIDLAGWNQPFFVEPGTLYTDAGVAMVKDRLPSQTRFDMASSTATTPLLLYGVQPGAKPYKDISELYMAIGWWNFFRGDGTFKACPVPDPAKGQPVWEYRTNISITGITKSLTDQDFYNHIIVTGTATSPQTGAPVVPIRAEAVDLDPVTGIYGKAGRRTYEVDLPAITSQPQGQLAADALLLRMKGCPELVTFTIPPNPLLEPRDVLAITAPVVKASGLYVINGFEMPSAATRGQQISCFRQSIAA